LSVWRWDEDNGVGGIKHWVDGVVILATGATEPCLVVFSFPRRWEGNPIEGYWGRFIVFVYCISGVDGDVEV